MYCETTNFIQELLDKITLLKDRLVEYGFAVKFIYIRNPAYAKSAFYQELEETFVMRLHRQLGELNMFTAGQESHTYEFEKTIADVTWNGHLGQRSVGNLVKMVTQLLEPGIDTTDYDRAKTANSGLRNNLWEWPAAILGLTRDEAYLIQHKATAERC